MNECTALRRPPPLFKRKPQVIEPGAVDVQALTPGPEHSDELWRELQRMPELRLGLAQRLLEFLDLGHVNPGPDEPLQVSRKDYAWARH